jgi:LCP family protein required for cell wall assembly
MTKKIILYFLIFLGIFTTFFGISFFLVFGYISRNTNTPFLYFPKLIVNTRENRTLRSGFSFLILGLDPRDDKLEKTITTDTIILANLKPKMQLDLISLPRDLWDYQLSVKINQIYPLSVAETQPIPYIQSNFSRLTGQKVERTIILTTKNLIDIVNLVGGVDVYLEKGFRDEEYPNPDYINNPIPEIPIYKTVEFPQGQVHLNSSNVTEFVRSRKSADTAEAGGTDIGRIQRQQLLVDSLLNKFRTVELYKQPKIIFSLYSYWHKQILTNFSDQDLLSIFLESYKNVTDLKINRIEIPSGEDPKTDIIYHPKSFINSQWVFIPQDKEYRSFQKYIDDSLSGHLP